MNIKVGDESIHDFIMEGEKLFAKHKNYSINLGKATPPVSNSDLGLD